MNKPVQPPESGAAHTPTPWTMQLASGPYPNWFLIYAEKSNPPLIVQVLRGTSIASQMGHTDYYDDRTPRHLAAEANAAFIVECVNSHAALLAEREGLLTLLREALPFVRMRANRNDGRGVLDREQDLAVISENEIRAALASRGSV